MYTGKIGRQRVFYLQNGRTPLHMACIALRPDSGTYPPNMEVVAESVSDLKQFIIKFCLGRYIMKSVHEVSPWVASNLAL